VILSGFQIYDRVRRNPVHAEMMSDFHGTVVGFENNVERAGVDGIIAVLDTDAKGNEVDYSVRQLVIVKIDGQGLGTFNPSWLVKDGG
jgi:hypothetical protein